MPSATCRYRQFMMRPTARQSMVDAGRHPIAQTASFLALIGLGVFLLGRGEGESDLADSTEWLVWKATAAAGQALALTLLLHGAGKLVALRGCVRERSYWISVGAAATFAVLLVLSIGELVQSQRTWDISGMEKRLAWIVGIGTMCAAPWVAVVWIAYDRSRAAETSRQLVDAWDDIVGAAQAFALFVVIAVLPTGALLRLWLAQADEQRSVEDLREVFDAPDVALYGAMYGLVIIAIVIPLVAAWRRSARAYVEQRYPITESLPKDWHEDRAKLEHLLGLDVTLIRNPLTALSVLTPLLTSIVATYVPSVGGT